MSNGQHAMKRAKVLTFEMLIIMRWWASIRNSFSGTHFQHFRFCFYSRRVVDSMGTSGIKSLSNSICGAAAAIATASIGKKLKQYQRSGVFAHMKNENRSQRAARALHFVSYVRVCENATRDNNNNYYRMINCTFPYVFFTFVHCRH